MTTLVQEARALGLSAFGEGWLPSIEARANGRIEVIGNHIDYSGGPVVAAAIDRGLVVLAARTGMPGVRASFPDIGEPSPVSVNAAELGNWQATGSGGPSDYLRGVIASALAAGLATRSGLDLVVHGDIPVGGGVSSSAALCVGLALVLLEDQIARPDLVRLAQQAEHRAGSPVGTMDQSASVFGGVILFGGSPDHVTAIPVDLDVHRFVVLGSGIQRSLTTSSYGDRVEESKRALEIVRAHSGRAIIALADVTMDELEAAGQAGAFDAEPMIHLRARHVVTETQRVRSALVALGKGDWRAFGQLMRASGHSSATDYAISHPRVEELVAAAHEVPGVLGARMMGGGEGGNALALVEESAIAALESHLTVTYYRSHALDADQLMFVCRVGQAASVAAL